MDLSENQKGLEVCYCLWGVPSRPSPGSYPGPVQVPSRVRGGPVQIRHVLCFTVFRTHPGPHPAPVRSLQDRAWTGRSRLLGHFREKEIHSPSNIVKRSPPQSFLTLQDGCLSRGEVRSDPSGKVVGAAASAGPIAWAVKNRYCIAECLLSNLSFLSVFVSMRPKGSATGARNLKSAQSG